MKDPNKKDEMRILLKKSIKDPNKNKKSIKDPFF